MEWLLMVICLGLGIWLVIEKRKQKKQKEDIAYIKDKLQEIMQNESAERLLLMTTDERMKELLNVLNELLDYNCSNLMKYNKSKHSMKRMLSNISHDLKTPLTVILGYLEMLTLKYKEEEALHKAYDRTQEVILLINKFFDLAKLESGDKEMSMEKVNISELCRMNILDYYHTLEELAVDVSIDIPEKAIFILGNNNAIKRILNNLISNAIKYGGAGKYLGIKVIDEEDYVRIEVIDHGKGIEERHKEEVFERMYTLEDSRSKAYQGSGLGLTITKELVELLGGEIHLDSKPHEETVFSFTLPKLKF